MPTKREQEVDENKLTNRYKVILIIIVSLFGLSYFTSSDISLFIEINVLICFGVWAWLFIDYKLLQINRLYVYSLILSFFIIGYGQIIVRFYGNYDIAKLIGGTKTPLLLLIIQRILRFGFKLVVKREPIITKQPSSAADLIYALVLYVSSSWFFISS